MLSNRNVEYDNATHVVPTSVNGTRCNASVSTGDNDRDVDFCSSMAFWIVGHMLTIFLGGGKTNGSDVEIESLVLLSMITSNGAN